MFKSSASAPASIANLNNGFDILGLSFPALQDSIHLEQCHPSKGVWIRSIKGAKLPYKVQENTATRPLLQMHKDFDWDFGIAVDIDKGIPVASGLGGSAASAVAAVKAGLVWAPSPLSLDKQIYYASLGEAVASGTSAHYDNIAPALVEGLVLIRPHSNSLIKKLPTPQGLTVIVWHPKVRIKTSESRLQLPSHIPRDLYVKQSSLLAASIADLYESNVRDWARQLQDLLIEPHRKQAIPDYDKAKQVALSEGAFCFGISGSGPSCFAICDSTNAMTIRTNVLHTFQLPTDTWEYTL